MSVRNFVLCAAAIATLPVYGEPIDLGCSARGPLAALTGSAEFREAIGAANPANFLSSVYDVNGLRLASNTAKSMHCPLFIDSDASPSASASKAILSGEASVQAATPEVRAAAPVESNSIVVVSAEGEVARLPMPEVDNSETQEKPQVVLKSKAARTQKRRAVAPILSLGSEKPELHAAVSTVKQEPPAPAATTLPTPTQVEPKVEQSAPAAQTEQDWAISIAQAIHLIKPVKTRGNEAVVEFNPLMALFGFAALFAVVLGCCILIVSPRQTAASAEDRRDPYRDGVTRINPERVRELSDWSTPQILNEVDPTYSSRSTSDEEIPAQVA